MEISQKIVDYAIWYYLKYFPSKKALEKKLFEKFWPNSEKWKIYWWIWEKDIISAIKKKFKVELSKKHIDMPDWHLKKLWESQIYIKLGKDAIAKILVIIKES